MLPNHTKGEASGFPDDFPTEKKNHKTEHPLQHVNNNVLSLQARAPTFLAMDKLANQTEKFISVKKVLYAK